MRREPGLAGWDDPGPAAPGVFPERGDLQQNTSPEAPLPGVWGEGNPEVSKPEMKKRQIEAAFEKYVPWKDFADALSRIQRNTHLSLKCCSFFLEVRTC